MEKLIQKLYESTKKYDFIKLNSSLSNFKKIKVSYLLLNLESAFGNSMNDKIQNILIDECIKILFKEIISELTITKKFDYIQIDEVNLNYNFPPELINKIIKTKFSNMILNNKLGSSIQDSTGYYPHSNSNIINTNTNGLYKIGNFFAKKVYVDAYMNYNYNRIILFDEIIMNFDNFLLYKNDEATRIIIEFGYQIVSNNSMLLFVVNDKTDPNYSEYIRLSRDEKINKIIENF
jgi:hypothetical protein